MHEHHLIAQHVTGGAQFALESVTLAQQTGVGIRPAVGEFEKIQNDYFEAVHIVGDVDLAVRYGGG